MGIGDWGLGIGNGDCGTVWRNVFGGGSQSRVLEYKVVNISGGTVKHDVFGGSRAIPVERNNFAPRWVNMWGGTIEGNLHGCSFNSNDGDPNLDHPEQHWASFVNMKGGTVMGNVYGAGESGNVYGSVAVMIGEKAIDSAFYGTTINAHKPTSAPKGKIDIRGSVFGGSVGIPNQSEGWSEFNVSGISNVYIDGTGYNTTTTDPNADYYMNIGGGLFGCGTYCESGALGRNILLRNYGTRNAGDQLTQASRTLTTIQRSNITLLDHSNVNLTGADDISGHDSNRKFGVLQMNFGFYSTNGSGIVLGATSAPAYMDSIHEVRSLWLSSGNTYDQIHNPQNEIWDMVGISGSDNKLYRIHSDSTTQLTSAQENVIVFNGDSRLWVRYYDRTAATRRKYGQLYGFFRMSSPFTPEGTESFAYARPKLTPNVNPIAVDGFNNQTDTRNRDDGGFLSYNNVYNYFTTNGQTVLDGLYTYHTNGDDGGTVYTKTKQYPYFNIGQFVNRTDGNLDMEEYREWVLPTILGGIWYVDGRGIGNGGWGKDENHQLKWGHFPDMPKKTVTGTMGVYNDHSEAYPSIDAFNPAVDIIYVVGPIEAINENENLNLSENAEHQLKLYRYPGGHTMSNGETDATTSTNPSTAPTDEVSWNGLGGTTSAAGPGANLGMMIHANKANFVMSNVLVDGLFEYTDDEVTLHYIPDTYKNTEKFNVTEPLVVADNVDNASTDVTLTLNGGTVLQRGYNNTDAATTWYYDSDYAPTGSVHHGGGIFVDEKAELNVSGLVTVTGNKQKKGSGEPLVSNVYLPSFLKCINIIGDQNLDANTRIGVTKPKRNAEASYKENTFSPVAVAASTSGNSIAQNAWQNLNFFDDQNWFFVNGHSTTSPRTTYYEGTSTKGTTPKTLYFGWTWANVVRKAPDDFAFNDIDSPKDMAWLISKSLGMNEETAIDFSTTDAITQTDDFDMKQYVWVPIGTISQKFKGSFDGQGHLITNMSIAYIGEGDRRYELPNYGLFGYVGDNANINRTFVVSGEVSPCKSVTSSVVPNFGGLAGRVEGNSAVISSSEAAVSFDCTNNTVPPDLIIGGLAGQIDGATIHSSMAMPDVLANSTSGGGFVGGLVGYATSGNVHNSFANAKFDATGNENLMKFGGLVGTNTYANLSNCYANLRDISTSGLSTANFGGLVVSNTISSDHVDSCYVMQNPEGVSYNLYITGSVEETNGKFAPVIGADQLGYMYADNRVASVENSADTSMFLMLNKWVRYHNRTDNKYAYWARPGLPEINGDLPVLMLSENDDVHNHRGGFRSMGTYDGGHVLQYGGPVRDNSEVDVALKRPKADPESTRNDYLFIYGDIDAVGSSLSITQSKVSIYENASILSAGALTNYDATYVGITFDNSCRNAYSTPGMNYGIVGMGGFLLPRDWHMFSSPLRAAPQGFNYKGQNEDTYIPGCDYSDSRYYNNPWVTMNTEFAWLNNNTGGNVRYWMNGWPDSQITSSGREFSPSEWMDGYFPSSLSSLHQFGEGWIPGSDEYGRYPYGMDFYTWYEPGYHWINFKRNGPNHWHSDENAQGVHEHLDYYGDGKNMNEEHLIVGRGYMAAISVPTFMQSHGELNADNQIIALTKQGAHCTGWNLVGNPYHGFLNFDDFADVNGANLVTKDSNPFYVIYDADAYQGEQGNGFLYYPQGGSKGGEYAGRYLHPHQGFFVLAKKDSANLQFKETMLKPRSTVQADSLFREWQPAYPLINLYLSSDNGCRDVTVIEFNRPEWGGATKLRELRQGNGVFYGYHDEQRYAALFVKEGTPKVPLWFEAHEDDIYTMKWKTANANFSSLYLIDNLTGVQYDMLRNDTYQFEGHKGDYYSRFYIVFDVTGIEEVDGNDGFVFFEGSQWLVTGDGDLDFIDVDGRVLWKGQVHGQQRVSLPQVAAGIYMFRLTDSQSVRIQKVIVKKQ